MKEPGLKVQGRGINLSQLNTYAFHSHMMLVRINPNKHTHHDDGEREPITHHFQQSSNRYTRETNIMCEYLSCVKIVVRTSTGWYAIRGTE